MTLYELNAELIRLRDDHKSLHAVVISLQADVARLQSAVDDRNVWVCDRCGDELLS